MTVILAASSREGLVETWSFLRESCTIGEAAVLGCSISHCSPENRSNRIHMYPIDISKDVCVVYRD